MPQNPKEKINKTLLQRIGKYRDVDYFSLENKKAIFYKIAFLRIFLKIRVRLFCCLNCVFANGFITLNKVTNCHWDRS